MTLVEGKTDPVVHLNCTTCGSSVRLRRTVVDGKYVEPKPPETCANCPPPEPADDE